MHGRGTRSVGADQPDHDLRTSAEAAFSEYSRRRATGDDADFAAFCADRPRLAEDLRELRTQWLAFQSFRRRLSEHYGDGIDPGIREDKARRSNSSAIDSAWTKLVEQLSAHSPKASRYRLEGGIARGGWARSFGCGMRTFAAVSR